MKRLQCYIYGPCLKHECISPSTVLARNQLSINRTALAFKACSLGTVSPECLNRAVVHVRQSRAGTLVHSRLVARYMIRQLLAYATAKARGVRCLGVSASWLNAVVPQYEHRVFSGERISSNSTASSGTFIPGLNL